ncbi:MAG: chemotaxis response regulator protein-glutamate methylesterase [Chloroflexi bacterium]|nr:chemotaxis response regulator protein-glutamate methylesterase [Chloroflexota bacterium]
MIRVLIADDSAFMRHMVTKLLTADPEITVVGAARDGEEALELVAREQPDVLTLDVEMPRLDGLSVLERLMAQHPLPVVMLSALTQEGSTTTIRALELGAYDFVPKPSGSVSLDIQNVAETLLAKVKSAARVERSRLGRRPLPAAPASAGKAPLPARESGLPRVIFALGASTGGPAALVRVVPRLPAGIDAALVIVQHMPPLFTKSLATRLDQLSAFRVKEAEPGDRLTAGLALVAPGDYHLTLDRAGRVGLHQGPRMHGVRPAVDVTFEALAAHFGARVTAAVLTGMGSDGAEGALQIRRAGGWVVAQDEASCVVYGMPRATVERGGADRVVPIDEVAPALLELAGLGASRAA